MALHLFLYSLKALSARQELGCMRDRNELLSLCFLAQMHTRGRGMSKVNASVRNTLGDATSPWGCKKFGVTTVLMKDSCLCS